MLHEYLFVCSNSGTSFPERLRVIKEGDETDIPDADMLTGTVNKADLETRKAQLAEKYPAPEFRVATASANTWSAVSNNYHGLDYEYD